MAIIESLEIALAKGAWRWVWRHIKPWPEGSPLAVETEYVEKKALAAEAAAEGKELVYATHRRAETLRLNGYEYVYVPNPDKREKCRLHVRDTVVMKGPKRGT